MQRSNQHPRRRRSEIGRKADRPGVALSPCDDHRVAELALSWSGGKDSALALRKLRRDRQEPAVLLTTITETYERVSMHGVRRELLLRQAEELAIPLVALPIPPGCSNELYEQRFAEAFDDPALADIDTVAYGDLFLEDVRAYRERQLAAIGRRGSFPLWGLDTSELARGFVESGFEATLVCIDPAKIDRRFAGRAFDQALLNDLPSDVDPCGENGEFHTFVHAGPIFGDAIACRLGELVERDGFLFCDLHPD